MLEAFVLGVIVDTSAVTLRRMMHVFLLLASTLGTHGYTYYNRYQYGAHSVALNVCYNSVVQVTYLDVSCDSPYTFYYGNGANRNSPTCDYGDKATLTGTIRVVDNLQKGDTIYVTLAAYDDNENLLATITPTDLCDTYVGSDCTQAGTYSFADKIKFEIPDDASQKHFYPVIQMAFSTKADSGYNLGAVNTECPAWDQHNPSYVEWSNKGPQRSRLGVFASDNGMLIATCCAIAAFSTFIWKRAKKESDLRFTGHTRNSQEVDLMELS
jgi:hypothetical protein